MFCTCAATHKWFGCLFHAGGCHDADIESHLQAGSTLKELPSGKQVRFDSTLQAASRAFNTNRWIPTDRYVSLATRLRYFDTIITPVACFGTGHRAIFKKI